jgi:hypothetical protein
MPEQVLKLANHTPHPEQIAIFAVLFAGVIFAASLRARRPIPGSITAALLLAFGLAPLYVCHLLQSRGVYHVQVELRRPDGSPVYYAQLKSSIPGPLQIFEGGWRQDVTSQNRPFDGRIAFSAAAKDEFLKGNSTLTLAGDYYPTVAIPLTPETSAKIRGVVVNGQMTAVQGATVSIEGFPEIAVTDGKGNFVLPAHAGNGQLVEVHAQKDGALGRVTAPAGKTAEIILE